jgi:hypothetical protein
MSVILSFIQNSICLSVPHRKHITSPLWAQQVNAIYRFVITVYYYNIHDPGHYPSPCLLFKTQRFGDWIPSPSSGGTYSVRHNNNNNAEQQHVFIAMPLPTSEITTVINSVFIEVYFLLECNAVKSGKDLSTFRKHVLPPPPGLKINPSKQVSSFLCLLPAACCKKKHTSSICSLAE